ncbi:YajG family lipoprotein [Alcanivorax limicola]|uniref:YajG family lipoprotein n=1 Tax=Alcanivorax limicola TaxID=2874102 RepID=UPI001CBD18EF|nr:YajG family lipoprotein [Alcanivorax limicola]
MMSSHAGIRSTATRVWLVACLAALLSACGLSPQVINIQPEPEVSRSSLGGNASVSVTARDAREGDAFGSRGGIYQETSLIRPANDVPKALYEAVTQGLHQQGFNALNPSADATTLEVRLTELSYVPADTSVVNRIEVSARIEAIGRRESPDGSVEHTGRYQSSVTHDMPITPSARRNEVMINDVLERTLVRLLSDPKLLSFLAGNDNP